MRLKAAFLLGALMLAGGSGPVTAGAPQTSPYVFGRAAVRDDGKGQVAYEYQWPGTYFQADFEGAYVTVKLNDHANRLSVHVDDKPVVVLSKPGDAAIRLGPFSEGRHHIRMEKLNETQSETALFYGFYPDTPSGTVSATPAKARQIEFIGDSWTVGYGNTSDTRQCTGQELWARTDTQQAFGPLTARHFDADYQVNAFSGRGVVRNYDGVAADTPLPVLYPYALYDRSVAVDDPSWRPQLIVVGLGGNDFSTPLHAGEKWATREALAADYEESYAAFLKTLRTKNPDAYLLIITYAANEVGSHVDRVVARMKSDGEARLDSVTIGDFELTGCDWHLNLHDDRKISDQLNGWIEAHPDIWHQK